jgi:hypothetical protein
MYPRSTPTGYVVSPKPTAAMLEYDGVGYRSGISPFCGLPVSQKNRKVRSCSSPKKGSRTPFAKGATACEGLRAWALMEGA